MIHPTADGERYQLTSPTAMPNAGAFLWNQRMMIQFTCRGFATSQYMQPEPAKYAHAPNLEAKTFMQPEQNYYAHHPGRFVYIKDKETGELFSAPYEPVRAKLNRFTFDVGKSDIKWAVEKLGVRIEMRLLLPTEDVSELWCITVTNLSDRRRSLGIYPYFPFGYMSWMNQEAEWNENVGGIIASSTTPYQRAEDYTRIQHFKDKTYFLCETRPIAWEARQEAFEGEGGLQAPSALLKSQLSNSDSRHETPTAAVQYSADINAGESCEYRFLFGPAHNEKEIMDMRNKYLSRDAFQHASKDYECYMKSGKGCLHLETPDEHLDNFVNHWLPRQLYYHGDVNRLTTDPQTRNYLQDNMGMGFIKPEVCRTAIRTALRQQKQNGSMPDGILLVEGSALKYINQIPHTDHCVWLPIALEVYLNETGNYEFLDEKVTSEYGDIFTVFERLSHAMDWLLSSNARDARGLSYIAQGDWCDPMNMVGLKGVGVSGWLTVATAHAVNLWARVCAQHKQPDVAARYHSCAAQVNECANRHLWDGEWYARGITDDNVKFGIKDDKEGRIWLNPQAWSILSGAASSTQIESMVTQVDRQLTTPYGVVMFSPPYTAMREDIGRVTQKYPGQAENGSVYNHAAAFYAWALYGIGEADRAYDTLCKMIPGPGEQDLLRRGQLPIFIPNYYRGGAGIDKLDRTAGRSSQLFNTGTVSWMYRCVVEGLCGLRGVKEGLKVDPKMPSDWAEMKVTRIFRGATFRVEIRRTRTTLGVKVTLEGEELHGNVIQDFQTDRTYRVQVEVP